MQKMRNTDGSPLQTDRYKKKVEMDKIKILVLHRLWCIPWGYYPQ